MIDPRPSIIDDRMKGVKEIIAVSGGKGGVGKSLIASTLALALAKRGCRVGLFDLDFTSPSTHVILGVRDIQPREEKGIIPPEVFGLKYISIIYYSNNLPVPLRGADVSNALVELLSVTRWGELDYLVLDLPPGIGDATLDIIRLIKRIRFLIVTTSSPLAFETARKLVTMLKELKTPVIGVVENMKMDDSERIRFETDRLSLKYVAGVPYDTGIEVALGNTDRLLQTVFARKVAEFAGKIWRLP